MKNIQRLILSGSRVTALKSTRILGKTLAGRTMSHSFSSGATVTSENEGSNDHPRNLSSIEEANKLKTLLYNTSMLYVNKYGWTDRALAQACLDLNISTVKEFC